ncbi:MAG: GHKL domain-containing protein [Gemmatimonadota bacterium]|nr:MAG: GHKL domain-containing protein [Gemmatimonadota bacterium]
MTNVSLIDRLAELHNLDGIPREELAWLVAHGYLEVYEAGTVIAPKGKRIDKLWVILSGHVAVQVDRGVGPRRVTDGRAGDVSGMLPYSRMTGPPGDNYLEVRSELLAIHEEHFPEMVHRCPLFTAYTVHTMLDRARNFNTSALQDEKMVSLGKLAAGLAHELNNPASATKRGANLLLQELSLLDAALRALSAGRLTHDLVEAIEQVRPLCQTRPDGSARSAIDQADREDEIAEWLVRHQVDPAHAAPLADTAVTTAALDALASAASGAALDAAVRWLAARSATHALADDIEHAATRIYELVAAVKRFTYMDNLAGPESVDVEAGIRDTLRVLDAKVKSKNALIALDVERSLPRVRAIGGELNQVWMNLIDNALYAIPESGRIDIIARRELDRVVVRVVDNGLGIPTDTQERIFDPFFTTKPPGEGTGLGLDMTRRLVRRYHGDITVESRPGLTEFRVSLLVDKAAPTGDPSDGRSSAPSP